MADNGRWFKLWCSSVHDPDLSNLDMADFGRWAKLGAYIKEHGTEGEILLTEPARAVTAMLQLSTLNDVILCFQKMKNVTVTPVTNATVTCTIKYKNWFKYQGDFSGDRVRKFRAKKRQDVTPKKRGEEKRREEIRKEEIRKEEDILSVFVSQLKQNTAYEGINIEKEIGKMRAWLSTPKGKGRKLSKGFIVNWLNKIDRPIGGKEVSLAEQYKPL